MRLRGMVAILIINEKRLAGSTKIELLLQLFRIDKRRIVLLYLRKCLRYL